MEEVNLQLECARQAIMLARREIPGGTRGVQMAIEINEEIVEKKIVGAGEGSTVRKIERRRGIMIERDMRRRSSKSLGWM